MTSVFATLLVWGCSQAPSAWESMPSPTANTPNAQRTAGDPEADSDGDGSPDRVDCAPNDRYSHPGAVEHCDGLDNDCDGTVDYGTRALRLEPGDVLETASFAPQLGPGREPLTVSFRVRLEGQADTPIQWLGEGVGYAVAFTGALNYPRFVVAAESSKTSHRTSERDTLLPSRWTHVAFVFQPGSKDGGAKVVLYLDGVRYNPSTLPGDYDFLDLSANNRLRLSATDATGAVWMDELRFWGRSANRTTLLPHLCGDLDGDEADLIAYFPFEDDIHDHGPSELELNIVSGMPQLAAF